MRKGRSGMANNHSAGEKALDLKKTGHCFRTSTQEQEKLKQQHKQARKEKKWTD